MFTDLTPQRIARIRATRGYDPAEFARALTMAPTRAQAVLDWEAGVSTPAPTLVPRVITQARPAPYRDVNPNPTFTFIDLFAGIGGIRLPFQQAGGTCVFTSEIDKFAQATYAANFNELPHGDITAINAADIPSHDLLLAGFPCQPFSGAGHRKGFSDTRGTLFFEIQRILAHHRPKAFLLENVKQLRSHDGGKTLATILGMLRGELSVDTLGDVDLGETVRRELAIPLNYQVDFRVLRSTNFGVPQNRERIYIMGFDRDQVPETADREVATQMLDELESRRATTRLGDILEPNVSVDPKYTISDYAYAAHVARKARNMAAGKGFGFAVFSPNDPYCATILARYYKNGAEALIDQSDIGANPRLLTPRECARAQGFPENFILDAVSDMQNYKQFGNSVSVPVITAIAEHMSQVLSSSARVLQAA